MTFGDITTKKPAQIEWAFLLYGVSFLFSTLIAVNGRKSLKINKVTLCIWIFGWRKLSLHHVRTQETPQIRCL